MNNPPKKPTSVKDSTAQKTEPDKKKKQTPKDVRQIPSSTTARTPTPGPSSGRQTTPCVRNETKKPSNPPRPSNPSTLTGTHTAVNLPPSSANRAPAAPATLGEPRVAPRSTDATSHEDPLSKAKAYYLTLPRATKAVALKRQKQKRWSDNEMFLDSYVRYSADKLALIPAPPPPERHPRLKA